MKHLRRAFFAFLMLGIGLYFMVSHSPPADSPYIGFWRGENTLFELTTSGSVRYKAKRGSTWRNTKGSFRKIENQQLYLLFTPFGPDLTINQAPAFDGVDWTMVLEGEVVKKTPGGDSARRHSELSW